MTEQDEGRVGAELARRLREQTGIFVSLLELARRQGALIAANNDAELLRVLAEKQKLIERHQAIQKDAEIWHGRWETARDGLSAAARRPVEEAWEALRAAMGEVVKVEEEARTALSASQQATGEDLNRVQRGKQVHKAYGAPPPPPPSRFHDKNG